MEYIAGSERLLSFEIFISNEKSRHAGYASCEETVTPIASIAIGRERGRRRSQPKANVTAARAHHARHAAKMVSLPASNGTPPIFHDAS